MSLRKEFVSMAESSTITFTELCQRFSISRKTGYKWIHRHRRHGEAGLADRSRRPHRIIRRVDPVMEEQIVSIRKARRWGARKIQRRLKNLALGPVPACSTITAILHRHGLITEEDPAGRQDWQRFEHPAPNSLWQMDFKAPVHTLCGTAHPLTVLDDHSRFNLCLYALPDQRGSGVKEKLSDTFSQYGLPNAMVMDNGSPWGLCSEHPYTALSVWLIRLNIRVIHSRAYHPQTIGKNERFHRSLQYELLNNRQWRDFEHLQHGLQRWRDQYNLERPHDALSLEVPLSRYQPSTRRFPERLPPIEYPDAAYVRKVQDGGLVHFKGGVFRISRAFHGYPVGLIPTTTDGVFHLMFCNHTITTIDLNNST
jgi:transposase InsO family protein